MRSWRWSDQHPHEGRHNARDQNLTARRTQGRRRCRHRHGIRFPATRRGTGAGGNHAGAHRGRQGEGKVAFYTSIDLPVSERIGKAFEAKFPGIAVRVERTGAERIFQRIGQEYASNIHAVDVVNSSDAAHFIAWKRDGLLAPFVPEDVARHIPAEQRDPDGMYADFRASLSVIGYNTKLVKAEDAPKGFADLLDRKWAGKIVKGHPAFSGTILTATYEIVRDIGWSYFEKLAKQRVMQVQAASDPPKKLALGERAIMADGNEYVLYQVKDSGAPVEPVYPVEGTPMIVAPTPSSRRRRIRMRRGCSNAFCFSAECQQLVRRFRRHAFLPRAGHGAARPAAAARHQGDEGRRRCGGADERGDQGALHQTIPGVNVAIMARAVPRWTAIRPDLSSPVLIAVSAVLAMLVILPLAWLVYFSFHDRAGGFTLANFVALVTDPAFLDPLVTTLILALSSAAICCLVAAPMGWLVARTDMPLRSDRARAGHRLFRDAAISRRHRLGDAGGAKQRPAQSGYSAP